MQLLKNSFVLISALVKRFSVSHMRDFFTYHCSVLQWTRQFSSALNRFSVHCTVLQRTVLFWVNRTDLHYNKLFFNVSYCSPLQCSPRQYRVFELDQKFNCSIVSLPYGWPALQSLLHTTLYNVLYSSLIYSVQLLSFTFNGVFVCGLALWPFPWLCGHSFDSCTIADILSTFLSL